MFGSEMEMRRMEYGGLLERPEGVLAPTEVMIHGLRSVGMEMERVGWRKERRRRAVGIMLSLSLPAVYFSHAVFAGLCFIQVD